MFNSRHMSQTHPLTTTCFELPGYRIVKSFGVVRGIIVRSRSIVGNIGAPGRVNYTIVGDTVNVAQRIEQVAKEVIAEDEVAVLLSEVTRQALAADVETHDMGPRPLRGRDEPVGVHRLVL